MEKMSRPEGWGARGAPNRFVSYLRVSTEKQGRSGLGLEAQRAAVEEYLGRVGGEVEVVAEYVEQESGGNNERPQLERAMAACRVYGARLVVAKLDRLARNAAFLLTLRDAGLDFVAADLPDANRLTVGILAVVAQDERERISRRTKEALAAAKARGVELGNPENLTDAGRRRGGRRSAEVRAEAADEWAADLAPIIQDLRDEGHTSLRALARALTDRGVPTARGKAKWTGTQVKRVLDRLD